MKDTSPVLHSVPCPLFSHVLSICFPAERTTSGTHRPKKARQTQDLASERVQHPPGPPEHKHPLPLESRESTCNLGRGHSSSAQSSPLRFVPDIDLLGLPAPPSSPISSGPPLFPPSADVLEDDIAAKERRGGRHSPGFTPLPGLPGDQLLSDFLAVAPPLNHSPGHTQVGEQ